jgi:hypothetical protein
MLMGTDGVHRACDGRAVTVCPVTRVEGRSRCLPDTFPLTSRRMDCFMFVLGVDPPWPVLFALCLYVLPFLTNPAGIVPHHSRRDARRRIVVDKGAPQHVAIIHELPGLHGGFSRSRARFRDLE